MGHSYAQVRLKIGSPEEKGTKSGLSKSGAGVGSEGTVWYVE